MIGELMDGTSDAVVGLSSGIGYGIDELAVSATKALNLITPFETPEYETRAISKYMDTLERRGVAGEVARSIGQFMIGWLPWTRGIGLLSKGLAGAKGTKKIGESICRSTKNGAFSLVGGGDSALQEAIPLTEFASNVDLFCRYSSLHAQQTLQDRITAHKKIQVHLNVEVQEIHGDGMVDGISLLQTLSGESTKVNIDGVFIFVGLIPNTEYLQNFLETDESGHIKTDINLQTSEKGIFAAGDIRANSASQLISSAGDGATAAVNAKKYILKDKKN